MSSEKKQQVGQPIDLGLDPYDSWAPIPEKERGQLAADLAEFARQRRQAEFNSRNILLP